ncbi:HAMP domain-containing sensor histidine kinase [Kribbella sp. NPDC056861]|uniref:sensor histidine kinase n=1 Tax=Kribbella sp. NPDC056861 TaxID=3154857 RepID=UPI00343E79F4
MSERRRFVPRALSTAARVTLVAGLLSAALAAGFAFWIRNEIYATRYQVSDQEAEDVLLDLQNAAEVQHSVRWMVLRGSRDLPSFQVVDSDGWIAHTSDSLKGFSGHGPIVAPPARGTDTSAYDLSVVLGSYDNALDACNQETGLDEASCDDDRRLAGRRLKVRQLVLPMHQIYVSDEIRLDRKVAISVVVSPLEAEDAVASLDEVLLPAMPAAVLLIMFGAYFGTRLALRPVERIRAQAAAIGERNLHERVPVPPTHDVVSRLAVTLNETLDRLDKAADRQRGFIADAAHELRSPIASLRATLEVATEHTSRADWPVVGASAADDTRRLQELANDLLLVARLDAGEEPTRTRVDLAELVRRHLGRRLSDDGPRLEVEAVESAEVSGDERQLDRLLRNLVDNAIRHAELAVTVRVTLTRSPQDRSRRPDDRSGRPGATGQVVVHVDDDGPGIPETAREQVFERFIRLDEARSRDAGGVGLGLAIAREIAVRHGGFLVVGDSPAGGARLTITLDAAGPTTKQSAGESVVERPGDRQFQSGRVSSGASRSAIRR